MSDAGETRSFEPPEAYQKLRPLMLAFSLTHMLRGVAELGLADALVGGPRTPEELAEATGSHGPSLRRLLRALSRFQIFDEDAQGRVGLTPVSELLRSDVPGSVRPAFRYFGAPYLQEAWLHLPHSLRTGRPAFERAHGTTYWEYLDAHPEDADIFHRAIATMRPHQHAAVAATYDFPPSGTVVDVGGGYGQLLARILEAHPGLRGVLLDAPGLREQAQAHLSGAGVADRCTFAAGSFFEAVPPGGDVYLLGDILHDWPDAESTRILERVRAAMHAESRLLVVEILASPEAGPVDLMMMVLFGEGRQRSPEEFARLFGAAGLELARVLETGSEAAIVEARVAGSR